jgi:hypothetical protein
LFKFYDTFDFWHLEYNNLNELTIIKILIYVISEIRNGEQLKKLGVRYKCEIFQIID